MNKVILIGRLIRDPDVRMGTNNTTIARYTLAINRKYQKNNEPTADFIGCVALGKNGEFAENICIKESKSQSSEESRLAVILTAMGRKCTPLMY